MHDNSFLARTHALEGGTRVRLRLVRRSDAAAVLELMRACGVDATVLDVQRTLSYDPTRRRVYCACAAVDGRDKLVAIGAIDLTPDAEIDTLVVDEDAAPGLTALFGALLQRVNTPRRRAA